MITEVCANSFQSAVNAEQAGADRIELCQELAVGGLTPSYGLIKKVVGELTIPVHVLIRPRSGDFTYSDDEVDIMLKDIQFCKEAGCKGIVSGILNTDLTIDLHRTKMLINASKGMYFTFHRAFDWVSDQFEALEQLEEMGCHAILTSGQATSAIEGMERLSALKEKATRCTIMPGGGVRAGNAADFKTRKFKALHFSATVPEKRLHTLPGISMNSAKLFDETVVALSSPEKIRKIIDTVK